MSDNKVPSIARHGITLGLIALFAAGVLGVVNLLTAERIQAQQLEVERKALNEVFPVEFHDNDLLEDSFILSPESGFFDAMALLGLTSQRQGYLPRNNGIVSGVILPAEVHDAYNGDILLLIGVHADGSISGVRVLEHRETPGLGDKIELRLSDWILDFDGRSLVNTPAPQWQVVKDGGDFDQFTGATITPRALINGVRKALEFAEHNKSRLENL